MKKAVCMAVIIGTMFVNSLSNLYAAESVLDVSLKHEAERAIEKGLAYLRTTIGKDGSWSDHPGVTALVLRAFAGAPDTYTKDDGMMHKVAANYLINLQKQDGSIFDKELPSYVTANAIIALVELDSSAYDAVIKKARSFLVGAQFDEGEGYTPDHEYYGGIGYGSRIRPDLSNLQIALEALKASGLPAEDEAWQKAVTFINRCQNYSETNDQDWAGNDGGFIYLPGESKVKGTHQSYGSMTYAGLKSFLHANVDKSDPRVKAAYDWISQHYTVEENPGMGLQGLFYAYHTFAKALYTYAVDFIVDPDEVKHNWRNDLVEKMVAIQSPDGSWVNENNRWWESDKNLCTAYSILALEYCLKGQESK
ncbi:MAG: terpene cyclase/mutase family protein [Candidatus Auribacterota bacterium]|nr:terpene cyclase/mutase family protein [Candidatus Auribacterota bacterium]